MNTPDDRRAASGTRGLGGRPPADRGRLAGGLRRSARGSPAADTPDRHPTDLRLVGPAAAVWLTSLVALAVGTATAYGIAALSAAGAVGVAAVRVAALRPGGGGRARTGSSRGQGGPANRRASRTSGPGRGWQVVAAAVLACVAASALGVGLRLTAVSSGPVRSLAARGGTARLDAVVTADPRARVKAGAPRHQETVQVPVRVEAVRGKRVRVPVLVLARDAAWKRLVPSHRVRFTARLVPPRPGELLAAVAVVRGPPVALGPPSRPQRVAATIRARLRSAVRDLPDDERGVLPGLVDGDTTLLRPDLADAYERSGLTHLMAVSGENLSLVIGAALAVGRFAGLGRRAGPLLATAAIFGFVIVARPSPSVLRAAVMGVIALVAVVSGRERHGVPALCAATLILVLADPELARSYGFALSALATAGILVFAPRWRNAMSRRLPRPVAEPLAVAAAAQLACAPVLAMLGSGVSVAAVPVNLLAAPAVAPATLLGVLAAMVAPVSLPVAGLIVVPAGQAVGWISGVARFWSAAPYASLAWPGGPLGLGLLTAALFVAVFALRARRVRWIVAAVLAGVVSVALTVRVLAPGWPPRGWLFAACDVGQGDGLALSTGHGAAVVVDTGPDPVRMDRCLRDLGVRDVPMLVLTHPHADHIDGIPGVLHGRAVGSVLISPDSAGEERRLLPGRAIRTAAIGDLWTVGPLTLRVLAPAVTEQVSTDDPGTEVNNVSVVLLARWPGLSVLLSGDVEVEAQRELLAAGVPAVDVLKVPHHGSANDDPAFLAAVHARVAVISVGAHNDYGHPAPVTMTRLAGLGMRSYRTDRDGDIAVRASPHGPTVVTRR